MAWRERLMGLLHRSPPSEGSSKDELGVLEERLSDRERRIQRTTAMAERIRAEARASEHRVGGR